jgi:hypothetical protein
MSFTDKDATPQPAQAVQKPMAWFVSGPKMFCTVHRHGDIEPAIKRMVDKDPNSDSDDYTATALYAAPQPAQAPVKTQRYDLERYDENRMGLEPCEDGDYVKFADYLAAIQQTQNKESNG